MLVVEDVVAAAVLTAVVVDVGVVEGGDGASKAHRDPSEMYTSANGMFWQIHRTSPIVHAPKFLVIHCSILYHASRPSCYRTFLSVIVLFCV